MKIIGVIPARYQSSRFPGKPLADICGKPMIWWVYQQAKKVNEFDEVYIATDDTRIENACREYNMTVVMTDENHATGTDRVSEVADKVSGDIFIIVQGDEPLIQPLDIQKLIHAMLSHPEADAVIPMLPINIGADVISNTVGKLAVNDSGEVIFISRSPIPYPKGMIGYDLYKHVGLYAYPRKTLKFYQNTRRGRLETIEDNEMMRLIENHKIIQTVVIDNESIAVDTEQDLKRVIEYMNTNNSNK